MVSYLIITEYEILETTELRTAMQLQKAYGGQLVSKCVKVVNHIAKTFYNPPIDF